jgi:Flp pilus assembly protein TadG
LFGENNIMVENVHGRCRGIAARGQSLVETALFLPVLLLLIAGAVEVSNLLVTQNRVTTAARVATGYGAANFSGDDWTNADWPGAMVGVAFNNVTDTLDLSPQLWDIWTIKATLNPAGDAFVQWTAVHAHVGAVVSEDTWTTMEGQIQSDVLAALNPDEEGLEIVATVAFHNRRSLLGLDYFNIGPLTRVRGLSVMRVDTRPPYEACGAFPIAVSANNRSVFPTNFSGELPQGAELWPFDPSAPGNYNNPQYHWLGKSDSPPAPYPVYTTIGANGEYPRNDPGVLLPEASPGDIFLTKQSSESAGGGFGWLRWNIDPSAGNATTLGTNLVYPGNSNTYYNPPYSDDGLNQGDILGIATGSMNPAIVRSLMREHVDTLGRTLRLIVFTPPTPQYNNGDMFGDSQGTILTGGSNDQYELYGFVVVRVLAWYLPGDKDWLLFEFVRFDDGCGT